MTICERCRGTGFEIVETPDPKGHVVEIARACECRRAPASAEKNAERLLNSLRIPERYAHCVFDNFEEGQEPVLREAKAQVQRYCERLFTSKVQEERKGLGLLFTGSNGSGKTHLAVATLRDLTTRHSLSGQFWDFHGLMREIRNTYNPDTNMSEYEMLSHIIDTDVLLLDDLGAWRMTDWMNDTLFHILNMRYLERHITLVTTNYPDLGTEKEDKRPARTPVEQQHEATFRREYLVDRVGFRLRSRLLEMCAIVRLESADWRHHLQQGNQKILDK